MVVHTCNSSALEAETEGLLQVWGLAGLHSEFKMSQNKKTKTRNQTKPPCKYMSVLVGDY